MTVWLTGLSGAGKTTLALLLAREFRLQGRAVEVLDGDAIRENLSRGLGFSREDRNTNIRRIRFVANLLSRNGVSVIVAALSRSEAARGEIVPYAPLFASVRPVGSVAYKLLRVASGADDLTFSVQPKNEWDICGGAGLIEAAGLAYIRFDGAEIRFNQMDPLVRSGAVAGPRDLATEFLESFRSIRAAGRRMDSNG